MPDTKEYRAVSPTSPSSSPPMRRRRSWDVQRRVHAAHSESPVSRERPWDASSQKRNWEALRPARLDEPLRTLFSLNGPASPKDGATSQQAEAFKGRRTKSCIDFKIAELQSDQSAKRDLFMDFVERLSLQLNSFVETIRGDQDNLVQTLRVDHAKHEGRIEVAMRDLQSRVALILGAQHAPLFKPSSEVKVSTCPCLPIAEIELAVATLAKDKARKATTSDRVSELHGKPRKFSPHDTGGKSAETFSPKTSDSEEDIRSGASCAPRSSNFDEVLSAGSMKRRRSTRSSNKSNKSSNGGSLPSGLSQDANINDIEKFQARALLRYSGLNKNPVDHTLSGGSHGNSVGITSDSIGANSLAVNINIDQEDTNTSESPQSPRFNCSLASSGLSSPKSPIDLRRCSSLSLESLRQSQDSVLALSGLTSEAVSAGEDKSFSRTNSRRPSSLSSKSASVASTIADIPAQPQMWYKGRSRFEGYCLPSSLLRLCGVVPWDLHSCSYAYSALMLSLVIATVMYPAIQIAEGRMTDLNVCTLPFTVAGLLGALSLRHSFCLELFTDYPGPLEFYAYKHEFQDKFLRGSLWHFVQISLLWVCVALVRGIGELLLADASCDLGQDSWGYLCFVIGTILFALLLYAQLHAICVLGLMVDRYCVNLFEHPGSSKVVLEWNLIQAMLRQIAGTFDLCFTLTQTGAWSALLLAGLQVFYIDSERLDSWWNHDSSCGLKYQMSLLVPTVLLALGAFFVFYKAASVSEKCSRVAPLVNSMTSYDDETSTLDVNRMNMVHFVTSSNAGFYIHEVRITASMALKLMYLTGLGAFALLSKFAADTRALSA